MKNIDWVVIFSELWMSPDGVVTRVVYATEQGEDVLIALGTGFSCYYSQIASSGYTKIT